MQGLIKKGFIFLKALWLAVNPIASRRERLRLWARIQELKDRIVILEGRIKTYSNIPIPDNVLELNTLKSMDEFFSSPENVKGFYSDRQSAIYQLFFDALTANLEIGKDSKILDAGCGLGIFTKLIQERFGAHNICGFDFSDVAIAHAQAQSKGIKFFNHDIYKSLPEKYDVIICMELLEHLIKPDVAAQNLLNCLADGGALFLTVPDGRVDHYIMHINFWSPESWEIFVKRLAQENYDIKVGVAQNSTIKGIRYNWAILKHNPKSK